MFRTVEQIAREDFTSTERNILTAHVDHHRPAVAYKFIRQRSRGPYMAHALLRVIPTLDVQ